jgi:hypothetical protein
MEDGGKSIHNTFSEVVKNLCQTIPTPAVASLEIFLFDDQIINTQGSVASGDESKAQEPVCEEVLWKGATHDLSVLDALEDQPQKRSD